VPPRPRKKAESKAKRECKLNCCALSPETGERIRDSLKEYRPGGWAESVAYGPACHCGLPKAKETCPRHGERRTS
jgi:hypothetical protein